MWFGLPARIPLGGTHRLAGWVWRPARRPVHHSRYGEWSTSPFRGGAVSGRAMPEPGTFTVVVDDDDIRLDLWFKRHLPEVSFNVVSRWARTGQLRLEGKRAGPGDRVKAGQEIPVPPLESAP